MLNLSRATINRMEVIGEVASINLEQKLSRTGKQMIMGNIDVQVIKDNKINVVELKVLAMAGNKIYTAIETVMREYKSIQINGEGDKIRIQGGIELNEYMGSDGTMKSMNVCNARFFHRLSEEEYANLGGDKAMVTFGGIYMGHKEVLDKEGLPTGEYEISVFGRGYNGTSKENDKINCPKSLKMSAELFEIFENEFEVGENVTLNIEINRGVVVSDEVVKGFGNKPQNKTYHVWDYQIVGGTSQGMCDDEDIEKIKMLRRQQLADISGDGMSSEGKGFGSKPQPTPAPMNDSLNDDLPF